jgi:ABC-type nitrate/sulfonate/bicarbonate transport system substrate-binding protein
VDFDLLPVQEKVPFVAFLSNGEAEVVKLDSTAVFSAVDAGVPLKVVYEVFQNSPDGIQVPADSAAKTLKDLKGQTLGMTGDGDRATVDMALSAEGMQSGDVELAVIGDSAPVLADALRKKTIAAVVGAMGEWAGLVANGVELRNVTPAGMAEIPGNSFAVLGSREEELKKPLAGFLRAWAKGAAAGLIDKETVALMCKKVAPDQWEDPKFGSSFLDVSIALNTPKTEKYGDLQTSVWENIQDGLVKTNVVSKKIDVASVLDPSLIAEANDFDKDQIKADLEKWKSENK